MVANVSVGFSVLPVGHIELAFAKPRSELLSDEAAKGSFEESVCHFYPNIFNDLLLSQQSILNIYMSS